MGGVATSCRGRLRHREGKKWQATQVLSPDPLSISSRVQTLDA